MNKSIAYKWPTLGLVYLIIMSLYLLINHFTVSVASYLPLTPLDNAIPFLPWTGWIYATVYTMPFLAVLKVEDQKTFNVFCGNFIIAAVIVFGTFVLYPTQYPREVLETWTLTSLALYVIQQVDAPANCLPSGHVTFGFLGAFCFAHLDRKWGWFVILWTAIVSFTTLTTKQHYVWDVLAGYIIARVIFKVSHLIWLEEAD